MTGEIEGTPLGAALVTATGLLAVAVGWIIAARGVALAAGREPDGDAGDDWWRGGNTLDCAAGDAGSPVRWQGVAVTGVSLAAFGVILAGEGVARLVARVGG